MKFKAHLYSCLHSCLSFILKKHLNSLSLLALLCIFLFASAGVSDEVSYLYDSTGQLIRAIKSTEGISYQYDANGNLVAAASGAASTTSPVIQRVTPGVLFIGATTDVVIAGKSLFSIKSIRSGNPKLGIRVNAVADTQISVSITVSPDAVPGSSTLTVETLYGTATAAVSLSGSRVEFIPDALSLAIGGSGNVDVRIIPAVSSPLTLWLTSSNPSAISIPNSVTVPESGMSTFEVKALAQGSAEIVSCSAGTSIYVAPAFSLAAGEAAWATSKPVSVFIDSQSMQRSDVMALPVSVFIDSPTLQPATITASPVSVSIDSPEGNSTVVSTSVSVQISP